MERGGWELGRPRMRGWEFTRVRLKDGVTVPPNRKVKSHQCRGGDLPWDPAPGTGTPTRPHSTPRYPRRAHTPIYYADSLVYL